jgi:hypothetical protein
MDQVSKTGRFFLGACLLWLAFCSAALGTQLLPGGQQLTLGWKASPDPTVVGYYVYYGTTSGVYTTKIDVGTNTAFTVSGLVAGTTYYFTETSHNTALQESSFVPEISWVIPGVLTVTLLSTNSINPTNLTTSVQFPVAPGQSYELQASSDLNTWINLWSTPNQPTNGWIQYTEPYTNTLPARFYRLNAN